MRGATNDAPRIPASQGVSIHAPRVGRDLCHNVLRVVRLVSIHAPRVGRDCPGLRETALSKRFNPRAPCGARRVSAPANPLTFAFQSTRPMRGATGCAVGFDVPVSVSIHAPHAGRDCRMIVSEPVEGVSIHAPHAGRDPIIWIARETSPMFQSTRPVWGATDMYMHLCTNRSFQSTRPVWGATAANHHVPNRDLVSIHAPRVGRDVDQAAPLCPLQSFNPRAPCGARRFLIVFSSQNPGFNPRAPCGARPSQGIVFHRQSGFNPRAPCGARL